MSLHQMLFPNAPFKHETLNLADLGKKETLVLPLAYLHPRFPEPADFFVRVIKKFVRSI